MDGQVKDTLAQRDKYKALYDESQKQLQLQIAKNTELRKELESRQVPDPDETDLLFSKFLESDAGNIICTQDLMQKLGLKISNIKCLNKKVTSKPTGQLNEDVC